MFAVLPLLPLFMSTLMCLTFYINLYQLCNIVTLSLDTRPSETRLHDKATPVMCAFNKKITQNHT